MNLVYVPIEHIDMRYTSHLDIDIQKYLSDEKIPYLKITPPYKSPAPPQGQFLHAANTIKNKMQQLDQIAGLYEAGKITNNTRFFFSDLWFPGIESLAYLNHFYKVKPKITGIIHAGSFTDTDHVREMERWAKNFEDIIFDMCDRIYVASSFLKVDILKKRLVDDRKLMVTGLPLDSKLSVYRSGVVEKENIVIFNGRICDEKQPWLFDELREQCKASGWEFISTHKEQLSKEDYYKLLRRSKIIVSYALQENFGYGIAEAVELGCIPVVPDRLVYKELYSSEYRYRSFRESVVLTLRAMDGALKAPANICHNNYAIFNNWFK